MRNKSLAADYISRAGHRLAALEVLMQRQSYADVVREAQEIVELCMKGLLRVANVEVPRLHDVSDILANAAAALPASVKPHVAQLGRVSRNLRRDRELAFYGSEDLTPSEFYKEEDAKQAFDDAKWVFSICKGVL
ncbi:MAG: HEPN domain protein [bacterium ADurb.Bin270]|nr:HEPN domain-containing protein [Myxococcales bacterium]OQA59084.1 MAG: HEPN domain protein [bacterium ADurb.Bin270]HQG13856.1 HEPN domain-containing protein [bacterium]HQH79950.1 HEPN domain-containing protein [bacterium]